MCTLRPKRIRIFIIIILKSSIVVDEIIKQLISFFPKLIIFFPVLLELSCFFITCMFVVLFLLLLGKFFCCISRRQRVCRRRRRVCGRLIRVVPFHVTGHGYNRIGSVGPFGRTTCIFCTYFKSIWLIVFDVLFNFKVRHIAINRYKRFIVVLLNVIAYNFTATIVDGCYPSQCNRTFVGGCQYRSWCIGPA